MSRLRSAITYRPGSRVTHMFLGGEYIVVESHGYSTDVVTDDEDRVDISFATVDLSPVV